MARDATPLRSPLKQIKFAEAHVIQRRPTKVGLEGSPLGTIVLCRMHKTRLVSSCFKPSRPQRIISGLKETFVKKYLPEKTNKAEIRPKEQSEKAESCRKNLWNEIQLKGQYRQK